MKLQRPHVRPSPVARPLARRPAGRPPAGLSSPRPPARRPPAVSLTGVSQRTHATMPTCAQRQFFLKSAWRVRPPVHREWCVNACCERQHKRLARHRLLWSANILSLTGVSQRKHATTPTRAQRPGFLRKNVWRVSANCEGQQKPLARQCQLWIAKILSLAGVSQRKHGTLPTRAQRPWYFKKSVWRVSASCGMPIY